MLRAIIIDDEQDAIDFLKGALKQYCPEVEVAGVARNIIDGKKAILEQQPDLVFLDIAMPSGNGFELLNLLPERNFNLVFITAYSEHAIRAFRYSAIDYLLKPIDIGELIQAVYKTGKSVEISKTDRFNVLLDNLRSVVPKKISIPTTQGFEYVAVEEIIRIEADRSYCCFYLTNRRKFMVSRCLNDYQQLLAERTFFRVHHSHLVNLKHVRSYVRKDGGIIEMADGSQVQISRTKKEFFLSAMKQIVL
jgi:two-component system LytT family response regulator